MYEMQITIERVAESGVVREWVSVRPSGSDTPYRYATEAEAQRMLDICYPRVEMMHHGAGRRVIAVEVAK